MDHKRQGFESRNIRPLGEKSQQENRSRTPRRQNHHQGNAETQQGKRKNLGDIALRRNVIASNAKQSSALNKESP